MGYTRYYEIKNPLDSEKFKNFSKSCRVLTEMVTEKWGEGISDWRGEGDPVFSDTEVCFNGIGINSCETFRIRSSDLGFSFTKTNLNYYDRHVFVCLILAKIYFEDSIRIKSDGIGLGEDIRSWVDEIIRDQKIDSILD